MAAESVISGITQKRSKGEKERGVWSGVRLLFSSFTLAVFPGDKSAPVSPQTP